MNKEIIKHIIYSRIIPLLIAITIVAGYSVYRVMESTEKVEKRVYNLNLTESYNLDTLNISDDIKWITPSKNVILKNNVVTATESGKARLYAKKDNKIVYEIELNILTGKETLSLEEHTFVVIPGESKQISITKNDNKTENINFLDKILEFLNPSSKQKPKTESKKDITNDKNNNEKNNKTNNNKNDNNNTETTNEIEYKSEDETIAIVDEDGEIEAVSPGTTEINVKDNQGNEDHAIVIVKEDELIIFNKDYTIYNGDEIIIGCSLNSNTYKMKDIKWTSSNLNIVTVDNTGKVTTVNTGTAIITASVGNIKETVKIEVKENIVLPTDIELTTNSIGLLEGESIQVSAKVIPENSTNNTLSWSSNNTNIATVSNGLIVGKSEGNTTIIVSTSNGIRKEISVNISKKKVETEPENTEILLKNIKINVGNLTLEEGNTTQINAILEPSNATNKDIIWSTSNSNVATINQNGTITALKEGTTTITVSSTTNSEIKDSIELIVKKNSKAVSDVIINEKNITVKVGGETRLTVTVLPSTALNKNVTWTTSNTNIATIDNNGILNAKNIGTAIITATSISNPYIKGQSTITVEPIEVANITLSTTSVTIKKGETQTITATPQPSNATNKTLTWKSNNTSIATVDNNGKITGVSVGKTTITVSSNNNITKTINVEITPNTKVYTSLHSLGKINVGNAILTVPTIDSHSTAQGFTIAENYYIAAKIKSDNSSAYIHIYDKNTLAKVSAFKVTSELKHANDLAYNPNTKQVLVAMTIDTNFRFFSLQDAILGNNKMSKNAFIYNGNAKSFSGIDYDTTNNKYYTAVGDYVYIYSNFTTLDKRFKKIDKDTPQGIGAYQGKILVIRYSSASSAASGDIDNTKNAIDIYRTNGDYLGSYEINTAKELEAISYNSNTNKFALYCSGGYIYETAITIPE